jgi:hypothetical protein
MGDRNKTLARSVAAVLGLGPVTQGLTDRTFYTADDMLRIAGPYDDSVGTKELLGSVRAAGLACAPMRALSAATTAFERVEVYSRIPVLERRATMAEVGAALATLHSVQVSPSTRPVRRVSQLYNRLRDSSVPSTVSSVLFELLERCEEVIAADQGPWGLTHMDAHRDNLLVTADGPVWVDFEYSGWGPQTLDVALTMRMIYRFYDDALALEFLNGYTAQGRPINLPGLVRLLPVYDVLGVTETALQWGRPGAMEETYARLATITEPLGKGRWDLSFEATA